MNFIRTSDKRSVLEMSYSSLHVNNTKILQEYGSDIFYWARMDFPFLHYKIIQEPYLHLIRQHLINLDQRNLILTPSRFTEIKEKYSTTVYSTPRKNSFGENHFCRQYNLLEIYQDPYTKL